MASSASPPQDEPEGWEDVLEDEFNVKQQNGDYAESEYEVAYYKIKPESEIINKAEELGNSQKAGRRIRKMILTAKHTAEDQYDLVELPRTNNGRTDEEFIQYSSEEIRNHSELGEEFFEGLEGE